jgi:hypothetical protein
MRRTTSNDDKQRRAVGGRHLHAAVPSDLRALAQRKLSNLVKEEMVYLSKVYGLSTEVASGLILQHLRKSDGDGSCSPSSSERSYGSLSSDDTDERIDYISRVHGLTRCDAERVILLSDELKHPGGIAGLVAGGALSSSLAGHSSSHSSSTSVPTTTSSSSSSSSASSSSGNEYALISQIERLCEKLRLLRPRLASVSGGAPSEGVGSQRSGCTFGDSSSFLTSGGRDRKGSFSLGGRGGGLAGLMRGGSSSRGILGAASSEIESTPIFSGAAVPLGAGRMSPLEAGSSAIPPVALVGSEAHLPAGLRQSQLVSSSSSSSSSSLMRIAAIVPQNQSVAGHKRRAPEASSSSDSKEEEEDAGDADDEAAGAGSNMAAKRRRVGEAAPATEQGGSGAAGVAASAAALAAGAATSASGISSSSPSSGSAAAQQEHHQLDLDAEIAAAMEMENQQEGVGEAGGEGGAGAAEL